MTIKEMAQMLNADAYYSVIIDNKSDVEVYNGTSEKQRTYNRKAYSECEDCEVIAIRPYSENAIAFIVDAPIRHFETWLDVEYSLLVSLDVPYGVDYKKALEEYAKPKLAVLPKTIKFGDDEWAYGYNGIESGSFFDLIERG